MANAIGTFSLLSAFQTRSFCLSYIHIVFQWRIQGGRPAPATDQNFLNFMQFFGKFVCWPLPMEGWRPLLRGILDPLLFLLKTLVITMRKQLENLTTLNNLFTDLELMGTIFGTLWGAVWGKDDPEIDALEIATDKGDTASVVELLKSADLNCKEIRGKAVSVAAVQGNEECLDLLIQAGADVNWSSCSSTVAIVSAAWHGHSKCLDLLLTAGADVNTQDEYGNTPLVLAAWNGHTVCLESLLQAGADVNTHNIEGSTAVYFAASEGHENCLRELIKEGANVHNLDLNENSALQKATVNNKAVCVELLIQAGADVNIRDEHGTRH